MRTGSTLPAALMALPSLVMCFVRGFLLNGEAAIPLMQLSKLSFALVRRWLEGKLAALNEVGANAVSRNAAYRVFDRRSQARKTQSEENQSRRFLL